MLDHQTVCREPSEISDTGEPTQKPSLPQPIPTIKQSYTVTCSSVFRDAVNDLATQRGGNVADLARSVTLLLSVDTIRAFSDPGEPAREDRETIILKSGPSAGRPWRRKPRLQVRMAEGYEPELIRKALGIALAMAAGNASVSLEVSGGPVSPSTVAVNTEVLIQQEEICRLRTIVSELSFDPLPRGISTRDEALHVLGFAPGRFPGMDVIKARYRERATIYHPDSEQGNHGRMSQINEAMEVLRRSLI